MYKSDGNYQNYLPCSASRLPAQPAWMGLLQCGTQIIFLYQEAFENGSTLAKHFLSLKKKSILLFKVLPNLLHLFSFSLFSTPTFFFFFFPLVVLETTL